MTNTQSTNLCIFFKQQANFRYAHNPQEVPISWVTTVHLSVCQHVPAPLLLDRF